MIKGLKNLILIEFKDSVGKRLSRRVYNTNSYKYKNPSDHFAYLVGQSVVIEMVELPHFYGQLS